MVALVTPLMSQSVNPRAAQVSDVEPRAPELLAAAALAGIEPVQPELGLCRFIGGGGRWVGQIVGSCHGGHDSADPGQSASGMRGGQRAGRTGGGGSIPVLVSARLGAPRRE
jgi:hypothetical protein